MTVTHVVLVENVSHSDCSSTVDDIWFSENSSDCSTTVDDIWFSENSLHIFTMYLLASGPVYYTFFFHLNAFRQWECWLLPFQCALMNLEPEICSVICCKAHSVSRILWRTALLHIACNQVFKLNWYELKLNVVVLPAYFHIFDHGWSNVGFGLWNLDEILALFI